MLTIDVRGLQDVQARLAGLARGMQDKVLIPAINKVANKGKAEINRVIPEIYNVKKSDVSSSVSIFGARSSRPRAVISIFGSRNRRGRSLNLIHFLAAVQAAGAAHKTRGARTNNKALSTLGKQIGFLIKKGSGLKTIPGSFIGNSGRTIFKRDPSKQAKNRPGPLNKHTQALDPVQVIGYSQMFTSRLISERVLRKINAELPIEVDRALRLLLSRTR